MRRHSVLEELRVKRLAVIQEECLRAFVGELCLNQNCMDDKRRKVVCHQHKRGDLKRLR